MQAETTFADRFWAKVLKVEGDGCWEWQGGRFPSGYGKVSLPYRLRTPPVPHVMEGSHRVAWTLVNGLIPKGLHVLHKCDNRACCRPDHLFLGTHQVNMADMRAKGRSLRGPQTQRKLTPADVAAIRRRAAAGESQRSIGKDFQIDQRNVGRIVARERYADVA